MELKDENLLKEFREAWYCEWCHKSTRANGADPHHIMSRGAGWADVRPNLVALCRACHSLNHAGHRPTTQDLLEIAAKREGMTVGEIKELVWDTRRKPKEAKCELPRKKSIGHKRRR